MKGLHSPEVLSFARVLTFFLLLQWAFWGVLLARHAVGPICQVVLCGGAKGTGYAVLAGAVLPSVRSVMSHVPSMWHQGERVECAGMLGCTGRFSPLHFACTGS